ncbi:histidine phosphatase family protein [Mobilicoccus pelagius]|uniref:Phosphoglycerate mutase family protein n=1 Tax=Mobilicoccus pelagius NBRC 104925 TaxID=1089455 RepID=H5UQI4_9MICO|nr:histidine phosphatase family protein [Mobilicoccus pelagius]GAB47992.1 phosphoglycerate mutase family protein [Mobilicoccus pelagius NBRC 104925]
MSPAVDAPGPGRRIVVLRHGLTAHNARGVWQGHLDSPLTDEGRAQAERAADAVASYAPDVVVASDLQRARITAEIVLRALPGRDLRIDPRLREIHVGQWQGLERSVMTERFPDAAALLAGSEDFRRGVDGETYGELGERVGAAAADALHDVSDGGTLLLVTHGVSARVLTGDLLGLDRASSWAMLSGLGNCHWAELRENGRSWRLSGWNLRARFGADEQGR